MSCKGEYKPLVGIFLGDMSDELENFNIGSYIISFISKDPKFYGSIVREPDGTTLEICQVREIKLNLKFSTIWIS